MCVDIRTSARSLGGKVGYREPEKNARSERTAIALALLGGLLGLTGWLSWPLGLPSLRSFGVGLTGMSPLTGATLLVGAAAIVSAHRGRYALARVLGALVLVIGAVALGEWIAGVRHGIAQHLLPSRERAALAGRMSVPAALLFVLLGTALVLIRRGRSPLRRPSDYVVAVAALGSFAVVTAYAYGASSFAPVLGAPNTGMALPTGIALLALAVSTLLVEPMRGLASIFLAREPEGIFARRVALLAVLGPPVIGVLITTGRVLGISDVLAQLGVLTVVASAIAVFAIMVAAHRLNESVARRTHAEESFRIAESRLRGLIANAPDAILAVNEHGVVVVANSSATALFGHDVIDLPLETLMPGISERVRAHEVVPVEADVATTSGVIPVEVTFSHVATDEQRTTLILRDVSERKRAEQLLRMNEARFRMLFEYSTDGVFFAKDDGMYTDVNEAGCRMLGTSRDQIVGKTIADFIPPEDIPRLAADRDLVLRGGTQLSEWRMRRADGTWADIEVATRLLPDGRWVGLARDVSARKAAEEEIRRAHDAELKLRRQIEAISNATTAVSEAVARLPESDLQTVLHTVVLQALAITGARYGALGMGGDVDHPFDPWVTIGIPDEVVRAIGRAPRARGLLARVATGGGSVRVDDLPKALAFGGFPPGHPQLKTLLGVPIRHGGESIGHLFLSEKSDGTPFTEDDQRALEILADRVAIALETARLYEAEARERSRLQIVIDQIPEPVILADATGEVTSWNRAAAALARAESVADRLRPFELRWPNGRPLADEDRPLWRACIHGEHVSGLELVAIARDGREVPVLASASPLPRDEHGAHGAVAILQDITSQKALERLREEWTAIVAHDLRQPIASIALSAQVLQRRALGGDDAKLVERIRTGAERLRSMVNDLLDYAQIEAGRLRIAPRPVDLRPLVAEVLDRLTPSTQGHPVRLVVQHVDAHTEADPGRIDQVITNLVSNAAKYGYAGTEIVVSIGGRAGEIEIMVENRGPGMSPDELARLFEKFGRMATAEAMGVKGIGLGLFITKGIVEAHGGRIWAESTPFETTTFHVVLPAIPHRRAA